MKSQSPGRSNSIPNYFWTFDYKVVCDFYVYLRFWINGIYSLSVIKKMGYMIHYKSHIWMLLMKVWLLTWTKYLHFFFFPSPAPFCPSSCCPSFSNLFTRNHKVEITWSHHFRRTYTGSLRGHQQLKIRLDYKLRQVESWTLCGLRLIFRLFQDPVVSAKMQFTGWPWRDLFQRQEFVSGAWFLSMFVWVLPVCWL